MIKDTPTGYNVYKYIIGGIVMQIELTQKANDELKRVMESREDKKPLRNYIAGYG